MQVVYNIYTVCGHCPMLAMWKENICRHCPPDGKETRYNLQLYHWAPLVSVQLFRHIYSGGLTLWIHCRQDICIKITENLYWCKTDKAEYFIKTLVGCSPSSSLMAGSSIICNVTGVLTKPVNNWYCIWRLTISDNEGEATATPSRWKFVDDTTSAECTQGFNDSNF